MGNNCRAIIVNGMPQQSNFHLLGSSHRILFFIQGVNSVCQIHLTINQFSYSFIKT